MPLFKCEKCGCVENTALCRYWRRKNGPALCSACDPRINKWHSKFPKRKAKGYRIDNYGFLEKDTNYKL